MIGSFVNVLILFDSLGAHCCFSSHAARSLFSANRAAGSRFQGGKSKKKKTREAACSMKKAREARVGSNFNCGAAGCTAAVGHTLTPLKEQILLQASWREKTTPPAVRGMQSANNGTQREGVWQVTLMFAESVRNMAMRSMPMPQPPVGGSPHSRARQKSSSRTCASSSPLA